MLIALFSLLFLVSTQLCYAMAHDLPQIATVTDCHSIVKVEKHGGGHSAPSDHSKKASSACVMMSCGGIIQLTSEFALFTPDHEFGLPPRVAALNSSDPFGVLRPPISYQI
ncbi:putative dNA-directed RNA polymerase protein [Ochrobactrum quorumnocens]|uniref:Putative dNA-directed RNA polymerase protein n=2 Tax=Ochrobactrum quorumnocens TaxID=271865 RepID=A0A248U946_9HYPH|nr:putative dNA-directed RNA polymerase protein [[Ochrobactrum] quorumnocens]